MNNRTRIRLVATVVAAGIGTFGLTACNSGDTVTDKPKAKAKASAGTTTAKKPVAKKTATPDVAKAGDTIALKGMEDGSKLDVTVVKVADPAKSSDEFTTPESGNRFVGVQFKLVNTGTAAYSDSPGNGAQITDADGQQFESTFADITAGPSMSSDVRLKPGGKALGWIVFEVPKASKTATVQFTMDSGMANQTGEWKLS
ncbi:DUF4352 domain-containing protein [Streptomyces cyanogenus]|uniref:Telomeric repeat-binding factor 2 n=1 Tax=Streptomyces cyanogenus TaxID=80860 RepID=A0ABX7TV47_STRCY|nr:DUF4352 domain-containing protein [Streptomyces cyanogenus]QTD99135.1 Telomeric repeat-binding factor 2 [Streptomyces cyanogenus]